MGLKGSKVYAYQIAGVAMIVLIISIIGWDLFHGESDQSGVTASNVPTTPIALSQAHKTKLPDLEAWLTQWQSSHSTTRPGNEGFTPPNELPQLQELVSKSDLSAMECLEMSRMVGIAGDLPACEVIAKIGVARAQSQLAKASHDDATVKPLLDVIGTAEDPLWGHTENGPVLEQMTTLLMKFDRFGEDDQRLEWARIGHGESLYRLRQYDKALAEADGMVTDSKKDGHWTEDQKVGIDWLQALVLYNMGRFKDTIPHLLVVTGHPKFHHSRNAWPMLASVYARTGNIESANNTFDEWVRLYRPDALEATPVLNTIDKYTKNPLVNASTQPNMSANN
jgi:tetratricopeptide (TPR) repeat protein